MTWIATRSGKKLDLLTPEPDQIDIKDIAVALSRLPRFAGHTTEFYSVAQHSVLVAWQSPHDVRLQALLHDAPEAYLMDLPRPVKQECHNYRSIEGRLWRVIALKYGVPLTMDPRVKHADDVLLETEHRDLMPHSPKWDIEYAPPLDGFGIQPWDMEQACAEFLRCFETYSAQEPMAEAV